MQELKQNERELKKRMMTMGNQIKAAGRNQTSAHIGLTRRWSWRPTPIQRILEKAVFESKSAEIGGFTSCYQPSACLHQLQSEWALQEGSWTDPFIAVETATPNVRD